MFLDSGTTVDAVARALAARNRRAEPLRLSVLTNTLAVATALGDVPGLDCVLLGGQLQPVDGSVVGPLALENLERFAFGARLPRGERLLGARGSASGASARRRSRPP